MKSSLGEVVIGAIRGRAGEEGGREVEERVRWRERVWGGVAAEGGGKLRKVAWATGAGAKAPRSAVLGAPRLRDQLVGIGAETKRLRISS